MSQILACPGTREQLLAGVRRPVDFALPKALHEAQPKLGTLLQAPLDSFGAPAADRRPETTAAMKAIRRLRDMAIVSCKDGDPVLQSNFMLAGLGPIVLAV